MQTLLEQYGWLNSWLLMGSLIFLRYALFASIPFFLFYKLYHQRFQGRKIQSKVPKQRQINQDIQSSISTAFIFGLIGVLLALAQQNGYTKIYINAADHGYFYLIFSFVLLVVIHDTYFYWLHRLIHHPRLFPLFHRVHHQSSNPTPWAALAFHPLEAIAEILVVPVLVFIVPIHPLVLLAFATWALLWNVVGHLGYEIFPDGFTEHPVGRWLNTSTHHNQHHQFANCNYGLYFNCWDRWLHTNKADYETLFLANTKQDIKKQ